MPNQTNHESTAARLRDQIMVLQDLILFLAQERGPVMAKLAEIANHAAMLAESSTVSGEYARDLLRISSDAAEIMSHVHAERHEIDRALTFMLQEPASSTGSINYIFPPVRDQ